MRNFRATCGKIRVKNFKNVELSVPFMTSSFPFSTVYLFFSLIAELGDYSVEDCRPGYVSQFRFVPQQTAEFEAQASEWHQKSA
ncbi:putative 4.1 G protein [Fasciolopsis buskii]|uniref:Putative 4.1 G protein n=1 Tax=Fasciolopsis buskii TaxID=27845 RepID=A0A8E0VG94_9TREM|nr:putative 4.1 G protein [Fasciolopsis buski]